MAHKKCCCRCPSSYMPPSKNQKKSPPRPCADTASALPGSVANVNNTFWTEANVWLAEVQNDKILGALVSSAPVTVCQGARTAPALVPVCCASAINVLVDCSQDTGSPSFVTVLFHRHCPTLLPAQGFGVLGLLLQVSRPHVSIFSRSGLQTPCLEC